MTMNVIPKISNDAESKRLQRNMTDTQKRNSNSVKEGKIVNSFIKDPLVSLDETFDYLFRSHLINTYKILELEVPQYLYNPLVKNSNKTIAYPNGLITPSLKCDIEDKDNEWENAGYIFIPDAPTSDISKLIKNIHYGFDDNNLYFRFEINKASQRLESKNLRNRIAIYFINKNEQYFSPIRKDHILIRGTKGEIENTQVRYLNSDDKPVCSDIKTVMSGLLDGFYIDKITFEDKTLFEFCFKEARLSEEEMAITQCLIDMSNYIKTGKELYTYEKAYEDYINFG